MDAREIRIGLLWHSTNSGNLGVGALTIANMRIVSDVCASLGLTPKFTIIGMRDDGAHYVEAGNVEVCALNTRALVSPSGYLKVARSLHCVLDIGAGDSFTDIYGLKRFLFLWLTKVLATGSGTPLLLSPQTIGPFSRPLETALAAIALKSADVVVTRDTASIAESRRLAPKTPCVESADVAFALPFTKRAREPGPPRVGINVSGLLYQEAVSGVNRYGMEVDYADLMRRLVSDLQSRGAQICFFTHVTTPDPSDDDGRVADMLAEQFPGSVRVPNFTGPSDAKSFLSGLDFVVSGRMHACIGAFSSGTPVVPVAYSRKFAGVFSSVRYPWLIDVNGKTTDQALAFILDAYERRDELAQGCKTGMEQVEVLHNAYRGVLADFLTRAAKRRPR